VEVNYHPTDPTPEELAIDATFTAADFEFVEVVNTSANTISMLGTRFTDGIRFSLGLTDPLNLSPDILTYQRVERPVSPCLPTRKHR
jgi:hypothetical protein